MYFTTLSLEIRVVFGTLHSFPKKRDNELSVEYSLMLRAHTRLYWSWANFSKTPNEIWAKSSKFFLLRNSSVNSDESHSCQKHVKNMKFQLKNQIFQRNERLIVFRWFEIVSTVWTSYFYEVWWTVGAWWFWLNFKLTFWILWRFLLSWNLIFVWPSKSWNTIGSNFFYMFKTEKPMKHDI